MNKLKEFAKIKVGLKELLITLLSLLFLLSLVALLFIAKINNDYNNHNYSSAFNKLKSLDMYTHSSMGTKYFKRLLSKDKVKIIIGSKAVSEENYNYYFNAMKKYQVAYKNVNLNTKEGEQVIENIKSGSADRIIENTIINKYLNDNNIIITDAEINDGYDELIMNNGGKDSFTDILKNYYGISLLDFKNQIYFPTLQREKLKELKNFSDAYDNDLNSWLLDNKNKIFIYENL